MGKGSRVRRQRADIISLVFCDLDFDRASRPFGRGVSPAPPSGWAMARAGLVYAEWDGRRCRITGDELIEGRHAASRLIAALHEHRRRLIVGHGLLRCGLTAVAMVTAVPDAVIRRSVDTLELAHRLRGGPFSTCCSLSAVAWKTLGIRRRKPQVPDWAGERRDRNAWGSRPSRGRSPGGPPVGGDGQGPDVVLGHRTKKRTPRHRSAGRRACCRVDGTPAATGDRILAALPQR